MEREQQYSEQRRKDFRAAHDLVDCLGVSLSDRGAGFSLTVHDSHGRLLVARGRAVGGMAAVWLEEPQLPVVESGADYKAILDALPIPVWLRDKGLALTWGNHAFLKGAGAKDLEIARRDQLALDKAERDLAAQARSHNALQESKRDLADAIINADNSLIRTLGREDLELLLS